MVMVGMPLQLTEGEREGAAATDELDSCSVCESTGAEHPPNVELGWRFEIQPHGDGLLLRERPVPGARGEPCGELFIPAGAGFRIGRMLLRAVASDHLTPGAGDAVHELVGVSASMRELIQTVSQVALTETTVLIEGETGTGKEVVAQAIHRCSARRGGPFQIFDSGAASPNLIESELFGHVKGAFTGADGLRRGVLERAHGGTLFLDEIGELPLPLQSRLLRVLEQREIVRLGDEETRKVNVRVVAATNRDLYQEVAAGRFRADLYYRLAVVRLAIPPLRARTEDIPLLVDHFLAGSPERPNPEELTMLLRHAWPGNVRELRNVVDRGKICGWRDAFERCGMVEGGGSDGNSSGASPLAGFTEVKKKLIEQFERAYLTELMKQTPSISAAARKAGLDRSFLGQLLRKHNILARRGKGRRLPDARVGSPDHVPGRECLMASATAARPSGFSTNAASGTKRPRRATASRGWPDI
jgi:DNA-binding NtrC family response regulator